MNVRWLFEKLRFSRDFHLGLGDIRLTIAQQDEIVGEIERLRAALQAIGEFGQDNVEYADKCAIMAWAALDGEKVTNADRENGSHG